MRPMRPGMATKRRRKTPTSGTHMRANEKEIQTSSRSITELPMSIVVEILLKTSTKTIVLCKCVCKTWRGLISDPQFAKLHLTKAKACPLVRDRNSSRISRSLYLLENEDGRGFHSGYCWCGPGKERCEICRSDTAVKTKLKIPLRNLELMLDNMDSDDDETDVTFCTIATKKWKNLVKLRIGREYRYDVVNSCNGFLCLFVERYSIDNYYNPIVVCNPVTGEFMYLPAGPNDYAHDELCIRVCGLGFSPKTSQYKVIRMFILSMAGSYSGKVVRAEVHVLGTGSWRELDISEFRHKKGFLYYPCSLNGALHWIYRTFNGDTSSVVSFDLDAEKFRFHSLPPLSRLRGGQLPELAAEVVGGRLCVYPYFCRRKFDMWVMSDDGVSDTWSRLFSHEIDEDHDSPLRSSYQVLSSFENGALLMFSGSMSNELMYYGPSQAQRFKHLKFDGKSVDFEVIAYTPSFISLKDIVGPSNGEVLNVYSGCGKLKLDEDAFSLLVCGGELKYF